VDSTSDMPLDAVEERVQFPSGNLLLEGILSYQEDVSDADGVLIIPPHPHFAGNMENNVVKALSRVLTKAGYVVMRFNYRGVGNSEINLPPDVALFDYWETVERLAELDAIAEDASSAAEFLLQSLGSKERRCHIVGYSFGAVMGAIVAGQLDRVDALAAICTPWKRRYDFAFLHTLHVPKLFINGKDDFVFDSEVFETEFALMPDPKAHDVLGEDHFYRGEETTVATRVAEWLEAL
jgi:alpha/beta superfamily hydrolase